MSLPIIFATKLSLFNSMTYKSTIAIKIADNKARRSNLRAHFFINDPSMFPN